MENGQPERQGMEINQEHVNNSLASRIANLSIENAQKDAIIIELNQEILQLEEQMKILREEVADKERKNK